MIQSLLYLDPYSLFAVRESSRYIRELAKSRVLKAEIGKLVVKLFMKNELIRVSSNAFYHKFKNPTQLFLRRPRVKYRGCYVCETIYFHEGLSENSDMNPRFKVTFYKLLRFFPDGVVAIY